ncbi:MAG: riboflavin synthase [Desulfovibrio sp.]|nr:riboflavin synthase [Desulfovibrio sp.]
MFTGLVQGLGAIEEINDLGREKRFWIRPLFRCEELKDGESIAVNGVCLSVEKHSGDRFQAYASRETLSRSNLGETRVGDKANLERALVFGERLDGHLVTGHIDCVANVSDIRDAGESRVIRCVFPPRYAAEVIEKGSVALDGISLTINKSGEDFLEVNVIPDSLKKTNISQWRPGTGVNMETDLIGKYVRNFMKRDRIGENPPSGLSRDFLSRNGFI